MTKFKWARLVGGGAILVMLAHGLLVGDADTGDGYNLPTALLLAVLAAYILRPVFVAAKPRPHSSGP